MKQKKLLTVFILFFLSGFSALIYQVAWQRMLFARLGGHIESVTIIVSVFMAGLGFGALFGGVLARRYPGGALRLFGILEILTGIYGALSLFLMDLLPHGMVLLSAAALFLPPTLMMGATLPLLAAGTALSMAGADRAVSVLSFVNTLGSAAASILTVFFLFRTFGLAGTVYTAAATDFFAGAVILGRELLWAE